MLAVVKKPHIELSINGEQSEELIKWISKKYDVEIINTSALENKLIPIEDTNFHKEMMKNRVGNLITAARLKKNFTQKKLAEKMKIKQNMISEFENGKRKISKDMAQKFTKILNINVLLFDV